MKDYKLNFSISRSDHKVEMVIKASCSDDAQDFGDALCENMPSKNMYSDKNDIMIDQFWNCYVEEHVKDVPPPPVFIKPR